MPGIFFFGVPWAQMWPQQFWWHNSLVQWLGFVWGIVYLGTPITAEASFFAESSCHSKIISQPLPKNITWTWKKYWTMTKNHDVTHKISAKNHLKIETFPAVKGHGIDHCAALIFELWVCRQTSEAGRNFGGFVQTPDRVLSCCCCCCFPGYFGLKCTTLDVGCARLHSTSTALDPPSRTIPGRDLRG